MNFAAQKAIYDSDISAVEPEMPVTFYWGNVAYTASREEIQDTLLGGDAGYEQEYDFTIIARFSLFPAGVTPPATLSAIEVVISGVRTPCRIASVAPSQDEASWRWKIKADN